MQFKLYGTLFQTSHSWVHHGHIWPVHSILAHIWALEILKGNSRWGGCLCGSFLLPGGILQIAYTLRVFLFWSADALIPVVPLLPFLALDMFLLTVGDFFASLATSFSVFESSGVLSDTHSWSGAERRWMLTILKCMSGWDIPVLGEPGGRLVCPLQVHCWWLHLDMALYIQECFAAVS